MDNHPQRETIMEGEGISKHFGGLVAVDQVDFQLYKGEILGLIGPNGAGKTTLFNMISGTMPMTSGKLYYDGAHVANPKAHRMCAMGIGRTYQICQPFGALSVVENVMVGAYLRHEKTSVAQEAAHAVLKRVHMDHRAQAGGNALTLPELKRMEVARALATEPKVLLLDEVIAGLNPTEVENIMDLIRSIREDGVTIIIIEHVMRAIMSLSDRIIVINQGKKIAEGEPGEVASNQEVIASYLGGKRHAEG